MACMHIKISEPWASAIVKDLAVLPDCLNCILSAQNALPSCLHCPLEKLGPFQASALAMGCLVPYWFSGLLC